MLAGFARFLVCTIGRCFQPAPYKTFRTFLYMRVILDVKVQRLQAFLPQKYFGPCLYNQIAAVFIPNFFPGIGRLLAFYEHFLPIVFGYLKTKYITIPLKKSSQPAEACRHQFGFGFETDTYCSCCGICDTTGAPRSAQICFKSFQGFT